MNRSVMKACTIEGSQPFDDLWYGLVNGLLPCGRPFRDVADLVRVHAIPIGCHAVHDLLAVQVEAEVIVELGQQPGLGLEIQPGGQVVGQSEVRHFGRPGHVLVDERREPRGTIELWAGDFTEVPAHYHMATNQSRPDDVLTDVIATRGMQDWQARS